MVTLTGSGDFYENSTQARVRVTFDIARVAVTGGFAVRFDSDSGIETVSVPSSSEGFIATGMVKAGGNAKVSGLQSTEQVSITLLQID